VLAHHPLFRQRRSELAGFVVLQEAVKEQAGQLPVNRVVIAEQRIEVTWRADNPFRHCAAGGRHPCGTESLALRLIAEQRKDQTQEYYGKKYLPTDVGLRAHLERARTRAPTVPRQ